MCNGSARLGLCQSVASQRITRSRVTDFNPRRRRGSKRFEEIFHQALDCEPAQLRFSTKVAGDEDLRGKIEAVGVVRLR
jgi:hypothetical protein